MDQQQRAALFGTLAFLNLVALCSTGELKASALHHIQMLKDAFPDLFNNLTSSN